MASNGDTHPLKDQGISGQEVNEEDMGEASGVDEQVLVNNNKSAEEKEVGNQKKQVTEIFQLKELNVSSSARKG